MPGPSTAGVHVAPIVINVTTGHLQGPHAPVLYGHMAWWVGGFICTLLSCIGAASGNVLKRLSRSPSRTDGTADAAKGNQGSQSCSAMWVAGLFLMTLPLPLDCVALALADASLIIPLSDSLDMRQAGYHLMLIGLKRGLNAGDRIPITLTFSEGRTETSYISVSAGKTGSGGPDPAFIKK